MPIIRDTGADKVNFGEDYKQKVFLIWYEHGKLNASHLYNLVPDEENSGRKPFRSTLQTWIREDFSSKAQSMDDEVVEIIREKAITEKVQMLERHTETAVKMQNIAMTYLDQCADELNPNSAVRMLIEGVRIERESRGLPEALRKMMEKTDEDLLGEIQKLITGGSSTLEPLLLEDENASS